MANCIRCGRQLPPLSWKKICQWCVQHEAAQRGEDSDKATQRVIPAPWVRREQSSISLTQIFFGANVAVFVAMVLASNGIDFPGEIIRHFGANYGPDTLTGQWWRLVTYMFLHGGVMHILFNMWCLWDLGALCESLYGRWTFGAIYLTTGVAAGLASVGWNPLVLSVGASGAIFGLAGALIASFYLGEFSLPNIAIRGTLRSLVVFAVFNLVFGGLFAGIDNACHIGGLVSGLILGALIAKLAPQHDARRAAVLAVVAMAVFASGLGVRQCRGRPMRLAQEFQTAEGKGDTVAKWQVIVKSNPKLAAAHFALAHAYFLREQFPEAEAEFKRVIELEPQNTQASFDLAMAYLSEKRYDEAKATFQHMQAQDPNSSYAHYGMGLLLSDQQNYMTALDEFKKAANSNSQVPGLYFEMGNAYANLRQYDDAISAYLKEKQMNGDAPDIETALADVYETKGMTQQAREARDKSVQMKNPHSN
jgi:rhomboid protease GluP